MTNRSRSAAKVDTQGMNADEMLQRGAVDTSFGRSALQGDGPRKIWRLPGDFLAEVEEATGGALGAEQGGGDGGLGAFVDFERGVIGAELGFNPAGVDGVDLDVGVAELLGEVDGEEIEGGLGSVIGEALGVGDRRVLVRVKGEGAEGAGKIDDATRGAFTEKREQVVGEQENGEEIGVEDLLEFGLGGLGGAVLDEVALGGGKGGIVDEDIEAAVVLFYTGGSSGTVMGAGDVELDWEDIAEADGGLLGGCTFAGGEVDGDALDGELAGSFEADAAVGAGDEGDFRRVGHGSPCAVGSRKAGLSFAQAYPGLQAILGHPT